MSQTTPMLLAFIGGVFLALHGGFNSQLSEQLKSPLLTSLVAYIISALLALFAVLICTKHLPSLYKLKDVPYYLWFSGALFSVIGIGLYYYTIPKLGISTMISIGLFGQILFSVVAGHFGWFGLPSEPIAYKKIFGVIAMTLGIILIKNT
ncbi:MAG: DMT family transporter [Bacteroidota bacterium]